MPTTHIASVSSEGDPSEAQRLIDFWRSAGPKAWFAVDPAFDEALRREFGDLHASALLGELDGWQGSAVGSLGLVLLLDQLSRNLNRGSVRAYAGDDRAMAVAEAAIERGFDLAIDSDMRPFLYLPFQHAEDLVSQDRSVRLTEALSVVTGRDDSPRWARHHRDIVARFGRFPHRNAILGRESTPEEIRYLADGGFGAAHG